MAVVGAADGGKLPAFDGGDGLLESGGKRVLAGISEKILRFVDLADGEQRGGAIDAFGIRAGRAIVGIGGEGL